MAIIPSSNWVMKENITIPKINQCYYIGTVTSLPPSSKDGDIVYNSTDKLLYAYYNGQWNPIGISGQVATHGNESHEHNYYYQESDLTSVLDDNYYPSSLGSQVSSQFSSHSNDSTIHYTQDSISISGNQVMLNKLGSPQYSNLNDWFATFQSAGKISGGTITDNGDGTVSVGAGCGYIKPEDNDIAETKFFEWSGQSSLQLPGDDATNYIYVQYNNGSPNITASTNFPDDKNSNVLLGIVYKSGNEIHKISAGQYMGAFPKNVFFKDMEVNGKLQRTSGLMISDAGNLQIAVTSGIVYAGYTKISVDSFDSSAGDTFTYYYGDDTHGWNRITNQNQIDNSQYYNIATGALTNLSNNKYGVHWVYEDLDGNVYVVYGTGNYTLTEAELAQPPSSLPILLKDLTLLIGKIVVEEGATSLTSVESAFTQKFTPSKVFMHNDLSGIQGGQADEYYHLDSTSYTEASQFFDGGTNSHSTIDTKLTDLFNFSSNASNLYYPSSEGSSLHDSYIGHSSNTAIHFTKESLDDDYYPSSLGHNHVTDSSIHYTQSNITTVGTITTGEWSATPIAQSYIKSGNEYWTGYQHSQITTGNPHDIDLSDIGETKGDLSVSSPLSVDNTRQLLGGSATISIQQADATHNGYLSSTDWNVFNNKQDSYTHGTLSNGAGIQSFNVGISGNNATVSVAFGNTDTTVASGSHLHDTRYYTQTQADNNFYPSSLGASLNSSYIGHSGNSNIHFEKSDINIGDLGDVSISSPQSGQLIVYNGSNWTNITPPITFSVANIRISANQNINLARFTTPVGKKAYLWMAQACNSGGASVNDLKVQFISGTTILYTTSSNVVQIGYPLAEADGNIEIRFAYSGASVTGIQYGTAFVNISIY